MTAVATPDAARLVFAAVAGLILLLILIIKFKVHAMISILIGAVGIGLMATYKSVFPFYISGAIPGYIDALFETVSGFTTTGASILPDVESMAKGLLYWRSFTHWVGGMGVLVFLLAIAPTSSTSILSGTSAGIDPVMRRFFLEEKKGSILPRVAPELSLDTWWYYKAAHLIDQSWSVRAAGVRQRHIDQAQSMNLYITNDYTMRQVLALYLDAWRSGVKTIYYIRSKSLEVEDCESCAS